MKIALVTTTINVPEVLRLYRAHGPEVGIFVAGDEKTPYLLHLKDEIDFYYYYPDGDDHRWACSKLIGKNCIQRRNIAFLHALKWGADIIVSIDDDNIPLDCLYFNEFKEVLTQRFNGLVAKERINWFDPGKLLLPHVTQRGIPHDSEPYTEIGFGTNLKVGVAQGLCLGDPDINAYERVSNMPNVTGVCEIARAGIVVDPYTKTAFNTQSTAFVRELVPALLLAPQFKRHDDIYAALICRRVMYFTGHHVHYGRPFVYQQRNDHDLIKDLENEVWGLSHIDEFAEWLDGIHFPKETSVLDMVQFIYSEIQSLEWMPPGVRELGRAWVADCATVL